MLIDCISPASLCRSDRFFLTLWPLIGEYRSRKCQNSEISVIPPTDLVKRQLSLARVFPSRISVVLGHEAVPVEHRDSHLNPQKEGTGRIAESFGSDGGAPPSLAFQLVNERFAAAQRSGCAIATSAIAAVSRCNCSDVRGGQQRSQRRTRMAAQERRISADWQSAPKSLRLNHWLDYFSTSRLKICNSDRSQSENALERIETMCDLADTCFQ
jgi:hypothetical protein